MEAAEEAAVVRATAGASAPGRSSTAGVARRGCGRTRRHTGRGEATPPEQWRLCSVVAYEAKKEATCSDAPEEPELRRLSSAIADEAEEEADCSHTPEEAKEEAEWPHAPKQQEKQAECPDHSPEEESECPDSPDEEEEAEASSLEA
nr:uncharacterized protein LOC109754384 [Aegilops tauschii subsp. strangulata]